MRIRFFASIRGITGENEIDWGEPTATLGELLIRLSDRYGSEFRRWVFEGDALGESVLVLVNGADVRHQGGLDTPLKSADVVAILPMMAGGISHRKRGVLIAERVACTRRRDGSV